MTVKISRTGLVSLVAAVLWLAPVSAAPAPPEFDRAINEFDEGQRLRTDQPDHARQLYRSAAQRLESIAAGGVSNGYLEYNIGNCYLQAGDIGRAILHYRRAERLIPRDALLADNLAFARSRCLLNIPPTRGASVLRGAFFWHYETSAGGRATMAVVAYVLFWLVLAVRAAIPRRALLVAAAISGVVAATCGGSYAAQNWLDRNVTEAVVVSSDVAVYKGPATTYQRQFEQPLQPGVEVVVGERRGGWFNIELADGKRGWIVSDAVETVPPGDNSKQSAVLPM